MVNRQLAVTEGLLEQCQAWQEVIDAQGSPNAMDHAAEDAKRHITRPDEKLPMFVRGETAIVTSADHPQVTPDQQLALGFDGGLTVRGLFADIAYLRLRSGRGLLTWMLKAPEVKSFREVTAEEAMAEKDEGTVSMPLGRALHLPVHLPVSGIQTAIFAGRQDYTLRPGTRRIHI